jgi:hypothetical protein
VRRCARFRSVPRKVYAVYVKSVVIALRYIRDGRLAPLFPGICIELLTVRVVVFPCTPRCGTRLNLEETRRTGIQIRALRADEYHGPFGEAGIGFTLSLVTQPKVWKFFLASGEN